MKKGSWFQLSKYELSTVRSNPDYSNYVYGKYDWMLYPVGYDKRNDATSEKGKKFREKFPTVDLEQYTQMEDGERVVYKLHICPRADDYLEKSRDIISTFLHKNKIMHKCVGTIGRTKTENPFKEYIADPTSSQFGKSFTIYTDLLEHFYIVTKGVRELAEKYSLEGIPPEDFAKAESNMSYERVVPGTNNLLYYTVERATVNAVYNAIEAQYPEWILPESSKNKDTGEYKLMHIRIADEPDWIPSYLHGAAGIVGGGKWGTKESRYDIGEMSGMYLTDSGYVLRQVIMEHYMKQGPLDFLY